MILVGIEPGILLFSRSCQRSLFKTCDGLLACLNKLCRFMWTSCSMLLLQSHFPCEGTVVELLDADCSQELHCRHNCHDGIVLSNILSTCLESLFPLLGMSQTGPEVIKLFPCSTQLSMKIFLLINVKMPTIVGILTFMSWKNSIISLFEP